MQTALKELPERQGTVFEVQAVLKAKFGGHLDKYRVKNGGVRWKKAVGEVLREEGALFQAVDKTASGKIVWKLKAGSENEEG